MLSIPVAVSLGAQMEDTDLVRPNHAIDSDIYSTPLRAPNSARHRERLDGSLNRCLSLATRRAMSSLVAYMKHGERGSVPGESR